MKDITHKAIVFPQVQASAFTGDDTCSILSAVLQYSQSVVDSLITGLWATIPMMPHIGDPQ